MKVIFFGTPDFVLPIPQSLKESHQIELTAVVSSPDKPAGRKQILTPSTIKAWAINNHIPVLEPETLDFNFKFSILNFKSDIFIVAAYGKIFPEEIFTLPKYGTLVVHPSLLPKYRGASPVQSAIANGDKVTGVTIIKMDSQMDHGPIIYQFTEEIKDIDTPPVLYDRLFKKSAEVLVKILPDYVAGKIEIKEQDHTKATYTKILKKEDGYINLQKPPTSSQFTRLVQAYSPWPGVWSRFKTKDQEKLIKFLPEKKVQIEGGKAMSIEDFLNGYPNSKEWIAKLIKKTE